MINIQKITTLDSEEAQQAMIIRQKVFVEEQGVDPALERDEHETDCHHYLALFDGIPVGTARWRKTGEGIKLERFAVLSAYRNQGIGEELLATVLQDVSREGRDLYLHAQLRAVSFYQRAGFRQEGAIFHEAGIAHYRMSRSCSTQP